MLPQILYGCQGSVFVDGVGIVACQCAKAGSRTVLIDHNGRGCRTGIAAGKGQECQCLAVHRDHIAFGTHQRSGGHRVCHGIGLLCGLHLTGAAIHREKLCLLAQRVLYASLSRRICLQKVYKQPRSLGASQRCAAADRHALRQSGDRCHGHIAVWPHAADFVILVAQKAQENRNRLSHGNGSIGIKTTVRIAGDDLLALGRHIDVTRSPVRGLHIREHRDGVIESQLILRAQGIHCHFAKLGPGQLLVGPKGTVTVSVQNSHQPQGFHRQSRAPVRHVGKSGGVSRT